MTNQAAEMAIEAPAKINLGLRILRRRSDGYHDILTTFLAVDWADRVRVATGSGADSMTCTDPSIPTDGTNLCLRAAHALRVWALERSPGPGSARDPDAPGDPDAARDPGSTPELAPLRIHLDKRIPAGAGLGGGSSDAAATLRAAARIWGLDVPEKEMHAIAAALGADVPFFLDPKPSLATGIGDDLRPLTARPGLPIEHIVIAVPDIHVSTAEAYAGVTPRPPDDGAGTRRVPETEGKRLAAAFVSTDPSVWRRDLVNDFEASVFGRYPAITRLKKEMLDRDALYASMSGSGSAVFGIFRTDAAACEAADAVQDALAGSSGLRVFTGRGLR